MKKKCSNCAFWDNSRLSPDYEMRFGDCEKINDGAGEPPNIDTTQITVLFGGGYDHTVTGMDFCCIHFKEKV